MGRARPLDRIFSEDVFHSPDGCWYWTGFVSASGYGVAGYQKRGFRAHRLSYIHHIGPIKDGMVIMHSCDNRLCVNPDHLIQGTQLENIKDRQTKNRMSRGPSNPRTKFSDIQIQVMRESVAAGHRQADVARYFKISSGNLSSIISGRYRKTQKP